SQNGLQNLQVKTAAFLRAPPSLPLNRVQRIREVRDQIVGVLAADGNPHEVGRDVERLLALVGHRQMRHRRGCARQSLGADEADSEVGDLQRVKERERLLLAALQIERKG